MSEKINDESYWRRCCQSKLGVFDVANHGGSYKRLYIEKHLQKLLETFRYFFKPHRCGKVVDDA